MGNIRALPQVGEIWVHVSSTKLYEVKATELLVQTDEGDWVTGVLYHSLNVDRSLAPAPADPYKFVRSTAAFLKKFERYPASAIDCEKVLTDFEKGVE